jgi:hypothetical protein
MTRVVRFYENIQPANNRIFYLFDDIVTRWSDYRLQVRQNYINWLFPNEADTDTKLTKGILYKFRVNEKLRRQVVKATIRMMAFFGYTVDPIKMEIIHIKPIQRTEENIVVGLYNPDNYPRITRILHFLTEIRMTDLSALFFLMLCEAMKINPDLRHLIHTKNVVQDWVKTQPYLISKKYIAEEAMTGTEIASWEKSDEQFAEPELVVVEKQKDAWDD